MDKKAEGIQLVHVTNISIFTWSLILENLNKTDADLNILTFPSPLYDFSLHLALQMERYGKIVSGFEFLL